MMSELVVYVDGAYYPKSQAKISVFDHGLLYGDGVFEGIREYNGVVFKLKEHIDRLYRSAHVITLKIPLTKEEMTKAVVETLTEKQVERLIHSLGSYTRRRRPWIRPTQMPQTLSNNHN